MELDCIPVKGRLGFRLGFGSGLGRLVSDHMRGLRADALNHRVDITSMVGFNLYRYRQFLVRVFGTHKANLRLDDTFRSHYQGIENISLSLYSLIIQSFSNEFRRYRKQHL